MRVANFWRERFKSPWIAAQSSQCGTPACLDIRKVCLDRSTDRLPPRCPRHKVDVTRAATGADRHVEPRGPTQRRPPSADDADFQAGPCRSSLPSSGRLATRSTTWYVFSTDSVAAHLRTRAPDRFLRAPRRILGADRGGDRAPRACVVRLEARGAHPHHLSAYVTHADRQCLRARGNPCRDTRTSNLHYMLIGNSPSRYREWSAVMPSRARRS